ncbi:exostoses (multiple)-like 3 [Metarhizium album ARSEF 1941]|uniref:Exostoses (Multiple)-like 3 n=1 Tax=Metarhizium album (strain ARSEF 1941) TaxID=1081103 RepID=A0A0B2WHV6_METAS|nr:exostoses (multiple)-like 3 [Metarhizium album ARSEF 1941]KHN95611.1 exostoses (multiple)-like 3 [Metarhizium album ARSEF 1941]
MDASQPLSAFQTRTCRRIATIVFAFTLTAGLMFTLSPYAPEKYLQRMAGTASDTFKTSLIPHSFKTSLIPHCGDFTGSDEIWAASQTKYQNLRDDKFTIALQTYRRPKELNDTLSNLLSEEIPSLIKVVVVWNDVDNAPPPNYKSKHGVSVRYRQSKQNSLNQKLWPDPAYETQAIFLSDDDIYYKPKDLEFVFQTWRKFGRRRMTGGFTRCADRDADGRWTYTLCSTNEDHNYYNMILSGLAFTHISFMDYYFSQDDVPQKIRAYVDEHFNCEDIALNFITSLMTGEGPLLVKGRDSYVSAVPKVGISTKPGHGEARSKCLNDYYDMFGCMPLVNETSHIELGVILS